jgi:hypothetical protein
MTFQESVERVCSLGAQRYAQGLAADLAFHHGEELTAEQHIEHAVTRELLEDMLKSNGSEVVATLIGMLADLDRRLCALTVAVGLRDGTRSS